MPDCLRKSLVGVTSALVAALAGFPACAFERGSFQEGLYVAPGQLFSVKSPLGPQAYLIDTFDRTTGTVTFLDETGQLFGVVCTPNLDILAGADNDFETDAAILRNWLREATFPLFFARMVPGSAILREEAAEFEGRPAWVALIHLPRGSPMTRDDPETGTPTREDSWRGVVVFSRGGLTYLLMTETSRDAAGAMRQFDAEAPGWNDFMASLSAFYQGMTFEPVDIPENSAAEAQRAGT